MGPKRRPGARRRRPQLQRDAVDAESTRRTRRAISGVVRGPDGAVLPDATVVLHEVLTPWPLQELRRIESVFTDEQGAFEFHPSDDLDLLIEVSADGFALERDLVPPEVSRITVRLSYGFDVTGFVERQFGEKSANCEVVIAPGNWGLDRGRATRTDKNGQFVFRNVPAGLVRLSARTERFNPATAPMVPVGGGSGRVRLRFEYPTRPITGAVTAAGSNDPIVGAEVLAFPASWNGELHVPVRAVSDERGKFELTGLGQSNIRVRVRHPDYSAASRTLSVRPSYGHEVRFELVGRSRVRGKLVGDGVAGAVLSMQTSAGEKGRAVVTGDGRFEFEGSWSAARAEIEILGGLFAFQRSSSRFIEEVIEEDATTEFSFTVGVPSAVRGRVIGEDGAPIAGARVSSTTSIRENRAAIVAVSGDDGRWGLLGLPPGSTTLSVAHDEFAETELSVVVPASGQTEETEAVTLRPPGRLVGRVTRAGRPLAGATVFAGQPKRNRATVSGPDGRFEIRGLAPASYRVKARYSTLPFGIVPGATPVESGQTSEVPDIEIQAGRRIAGLVQDLNGRPLADALVFVPGSYGASMRTDENGKFGLEIDADATSLQVYAPDFSVSTQEPIPERWSGHEYEMFIDLPVAPRGVFQARVLGLPERIPVTRGVLRVRSLGEDGEYDGERDIASRSVEMPAGKLSVDWVPLGRSEVTLHCQGYLPFVATVEVERRADPSSARTVLLEPGVAVPLRVAGSTGEPIANATVFLGQEADLFQPGFRGQGTTDVEGCIAVRGVGAEARHVVVYAPGRAVAATELLIPDDLLRSKSDPRIITLPAASSIRAQIEDADGDPVDGVVMLQKGEAFVGQRFILDGEPAEFTTFGPGDYRIWVFGDEGSGRFVTVDATPSVHDVVLVTSGS